MTQGKDPVGRFLEPSLLLKQVINTSFDILPIELCQNLVQDDYKQEKSQWKLGAM